MNPQFNQQLLYDLALTIAGENDSESLSRHFLQRLIYHTDFSFGLLVRAEAGEPEVRSRLLQVVGARELRTLIGANCRWPQGALCGANAMDTPALKPDLLHDDRRGVTHSLRLRAGRDLWIILYTNRPPSHPALFVSIFEGVLTRFASSYELCERSAAQESHLRTMVTARTAELEQANAQIEEERARLALRVEERTMALQKANLAKDAFLATMSHEIRTPLGGLLGLMELLDYSPLDKKQQELVKAALHSGRNLLRIVNDILDWSKIEAGKMQLIPGDTSIAELLDGVVNTYKQAALAKQLQLSVEIDAALSPSHHFDALRVTQILNNFASNAIKFTEQGEVVIKASLVAQEADRQAVCFSVVDSGIGMTQEQQRNLFIDYTQASEETTRMYGGTGLGLAICRKLATLMAGEISVLSSPGQGSTFSLTVSLPVPDKAAVDVSQQSALPIAVRVGTNEMQLLGRSGHPACILIVDDHPINRMMLKKQLELLGLQAEGAESGTPALSLWQTGRYDLLITDCHMPEMDGYELTRRIRTAERLGGRDRTPVLAWTANVMSEEIARCQAAGMDDLLTKPTQLDVLRNMLAKWLAPV